MRSPSSKAPAAMPSRTRAVTARYTTANQPRASPVSAHRAMIRSMRAMASSMLPAGSPPGCCTARVWHRPHTTTTRREAPGRQPSLLMKSIPVPPDQRDRGHRVPTGSQASQPDAVVGKERLAVIAGRLEVRRDLGGAGDLILRERRGEAVLAGL